MKIQSSYRIEKELQRDLKEFCSYMRRTESDVISEGILKVLESEESFKEVLKERERKDEFFKFMEHEHEMRRQSLTSSEIIGTIDFAKKKESDE